MPTITEPVETVDLDVVDLNGDVVEAIQVKGTSVAARMSAYEALQILLGLIKNSTARAYTLQTNRIATDSLLALRVILAQGGGDPNKIKTSFMQSGHFSSREKALLTTATEQEISQLAKARVEIDERSIDDFREDLRTSLRHFRTKSRHGLGDNSANLLLGYLLADILRRAADPKLATWRRKEAAYEILRSDDELIDMLANQDWGQVTGRLPRIPDIERRPITEAIANILRDELHGTKSRRQTGVVVLHGLSGMGKSSCAAAYIAEFAHEYDSIVWVNGSSRPSIDSSFRDFAARKNHSLSEGEAASFAAGVREFLAAESSVWIAVFDDVVDIATAMEYIPARSSGAVIVTTTKQVTNMGSGVAVVPVGTYKRSESKQLIRKRLGIVKRSKEVTRSLDTLAETFSDWPLALEFSTSYIQSCGIQFKDLSKYAADVRSRALDDSNSIPIGYPRTLVTAVHDSMQGVMTSPQAQGSEKKGMILASFMLAAHLGSRQLPLHLLTLGGFEPPSRDLLGEGPVYFNSPDFTASEYGRLISSTSLFNADVPLGEPYVDLLDAAYTLSMNEVTQIVIRNTMGSKVFINETIGHGAFFLEKWLTWAHDAHLPDYLFALLPHAVALAGHIEEKGVFSNDSALLLGNLASALNSLNDAEGAIGYLRRELSIFEQIEDPDPALVPQARLHLLLSLLRAYPREENASHEALELANSIVATATVWSEQDDTRQRRAAHMLTELSITVKQWPKPFSGDSLLDELNVRVETLRAKLPRNELIDAMEQVRQADVFLSTNEYAKAVAACLPFIDEDINPTLRLESLRLIAEGYVRSEDWVKADQYVEEFVKAIGSQPVHRVVLEKFVTNLGLYLSTELIVSESLDAETLLRKVIASKPFVDLDRNSLPSLKMRLTAMKVAAGLLSPDKSGLPRGGQITRKAMIDSLDGKAWDPSDMAWEQLWHMILTMRTRAALPRPASQEGQKVAWAGLGTWPNPEDIQGAERVRGVFSRRRLVKSVADDLDVSCAALLASDPAIGMGKLRMTQAGVAILVPAAEAGADAFEVPVLLMEYKRGLLLQKKGSDGAPREMQLEIIIGSGLARWTYPRAMLKPSSDWSVEYAAGQATLYDSGHGAWAEGTVFPDTTWLAWAERLGYVMVAYGGRLGVRRPNQMSAQSYSAEKRREEFRDARAMGLVAGGLVSWKAT